MKKIISFTLASVIFCVVAVAIHFNAVKDIPENNKAVGAWVSYDKDASFDMVNNNIFDNTVMFLGSSELHYAKDSECHPRHFFNYGNNHLMCIGSKFNQSLSHAVIMGAVGQKVKSHKAVLFVSPTWFYTTRDAKKNLGLRYSESFYNEVFENDMLSDETKGLIAKRSKGTLFKGSSFLKREKGIVRAGSAWSARGDHVTHNMEKSHKNSPADFNSLKVATYEKVASKLGTNPYNMYESAYKVKVKPTEVASKDSNADKTFNGSEYEDLELFIKVCREQNIEPLLVLLPINGRWYDYTGLTAETRSDVYTKVARLAKQQKVSFIDISSYEYEPGFFYDALHPSEKGWLIINEKLKTYVSPDQK